MKKIIMFLSSFLICSSSFGFPSSLKLNKITCEVTAECLYTQNQDDCIAGAAGVGAEQQNLLGLGFKSVNLVGPWGAELTLETVSINYDITLNLTSTALVKYFKNLEQDVRVECRLSLD